MGRRLTGHVSLVDDSGSRVTFGPGDTVPDWAAQRITNPVAWIEDEPDGEPAAPSAPAPDVEEPLTDPDGEPAASDDTSPAPAAAPVGTPPPQGGKGSTRAAWVRYAQDNGMATDSFDDRGEIIKALRERGIPVD